MGRRRKKISRAPKKRLPSVYLCPQCGKQSVMIEFFKEEGRAHVLCGGCGLTSDLNLKPNSQKIDIYCQFTDNFYSGKSGK